MEQRTSRAQPADTPSREAELAARVAELETSIQARDTFLTVAAHELRNPMYALSLHLDLALKAAETLGDEGLVRSLTAARLSLERYVERATTLLDVSRINAGHKQLQLEEVDFAAIVRQVAASYAAEAAYTGSDLRLHLPDRLMGWWDGLALEQIVGNLVSNAIKYGADAPVDVTLACDGANVRLTVRDRGPGIPAEDRERIFGRFEQVVGSHRRAGFGVGLWLVRSLLEAHGGGIAVESAPGGGAVFTARLPLAHPSAGGPHP
ncbi:sensor histidine kinase [Azospirillum sp. sgz301742]